MSALSYLQQKNGLKTTQTVVNKQQSGEDAEQKANPVLQASTLTESQLQDAGKKIDNANNAASQDDAMKERTIATQQAIQKGVNVNQGPDPENDDDIANIPVVKQDETPKRMSYADMFKAMYGNGEEETEEQKKKRLKRERTNAIISSVGDGLRALSNMYFATKNAKVNHNPEQDTSATMLKRKQLLDTQREKNRAAWLKGYQKAQELDENARKNNMTAARRFAITINLLKLLLAKVIRTTGSSTKNNRRSTSRHGNTPMMRIITKGCCNLRKNWQTTK